MFSAQLFQNALVKSSATEFNKVVVLQTVFLSYIKKWFHQEQFLKIFGGEIIPTKKSVMDSYIASNL